MFVDVSCFNEGIPASLLIASSLRAILDCTNPPLENEVRVLLKYFCCKEGARYPVLNEPLRLKLPVTFNLAEDLKVATDPKSE